MTVAVEPSWIGSGLRLPDLRWSLKARFAAKMQSKSTLGMSEASDDELIAACRAGSPQAFSKLVERHQQAVRGFLRRACGDASLADDLAQETFITAWSRIRAFDGRSSFRSWLCGIAYRKHLGDRRSTLRGLKRDGDWAQTQALATRSADTSDERLALQTALTSLPVEQRAAVALCLAADFSHAEASAALQIPLGTIKSHVARGRAKLLQSLGVADV